ncbi:MAG: ABC transporter ATP-binding protein [Eggerthellaceae bacterium]|nr:ABC transporter ATP-binding protein [Eggerthellaceae bacterium]
MLQANTSSLATDVQTTTKRAGAARTQASAEPPAAGVQEPKPLLEVKDFEVAFQSSTGTVQAVRKASFCIYPGQSIAIVGESGSGKSTIASAVIGLLPGTGKVTGGKILFDGKDITHCTRKEYEALRGSKIGLVPQDPMSNLNPVWTIGYQVREALVANNVAKGSEAHKVAVEMLEHAGLPDAERRAKQYPHEFSGGMCQRALIGIGLACNPKLLIADEPTSALDVTVQKRILDHLNELTSELGTAVMFITHDLGLAAERASYVVVMHRGRIVESGPSLEILQNPRHPYTKRLVQAAPSLSSQRLSAGVVRAQAPGMPTKAEGEQSGGGQGRAGEVLRAEHLVKVFDIRGAKGEKQQLRAVDDVSFTISRGTTLAIVGESGSGKSTVANILLGLLDATSGEVYYEGVAASTLSKTDMFEQRRKMQPVFQNPYGSLDPMMSIYRCIEEPLRIHKVGTRGEREKRVAELLDLVSLPRSAMRRYPGELSGGQRQRVAIARALALNPEIIVLDEAVSALDVLVQAQILQLLADLQSELSLSYLFITHDLAVVRQSADEVIVMRDGKTVETGTCVELFANPQEQYTRDLIAAIPGGSIPLWVGD